MTTGQIASTIVTLVEKHLGTGFDPVTDAVLIGAVAEYLEEEVLGAQVTAGRNLPSVALDLEAIFV
jgi:hypothetical protein